MHFQVIAPGCINTPTHRPTPGRW